MTEGMGFADVPLRQESLTIGFIGCWNGTEALARLLSRTYRTVAVVDMSGRHVGSTLFKVPVISAEQAVSDPQLRDVAWLAHRDHAAPRGIRVERYTFTGGGNERIRARLSELDIMTVYRLARQELLAKNTEIADFFTQWIHERYSCHVPPTAEIGSGTSFVNGGVGSVIHDHAKIGKDVIIGQNVTIGDRASITAPIIGDRVRIGDGARCSGVTIGNDAAIIANAAVISDIPDHCMAGGSPAKILSTNDRHELHLQNRAEQKRGNAVRTLRLKEISRDLDDWLSPKEVHRAIADDSLSSGPFRRRGTSEGFLATGNERPGATRRLVVLGGSFVESMFCPEEMRFASVLERNLPTEWAVLNGGYSGMTTLRAFTQLAAKIVPYVQNDDMLVYFVPMSDSSALAAPGLYWSSSKTVTPFAPATTNAAPAWDQREAAASLIAAFLAATQAFGMKVAVVASPYRDGDFAADSALRALYKDDRTRYMSARARFQLLHEVAERECSQRGIPFFDAQDTAGDPELFYDQMHLNEQGQAFFAEELTRFVTPLLARGPHGA